MRFPVVVCAKLIVNFWEVVSVVQVVFHVNIIVICWRLISCCRDCWHPRGRGGYTKLRENPNKNKIQWQKEDIWPDLKKALELVRNSVAERKF